MDDDVMPHALDKADVVNIDKELLVISFSGNVIYARAASGKKIPGIRIVVDPKRFQLFSHRVFWIQHNIDIHLAHSFHQDKRYNKDIEKSCFRNALHVLLHRLQDLDLIRKGETQIIRHAIMSWSDGLGFLEEYVNSVIRRAETVGSMRRRQRRKILICIAARALMNNEFTSAGSAYDFMLDKEPNNEKESR